MTTSQHIRAVRQLYRKHFDDARKERQLVSASSFLGSVRGGPGRFLADLARMARRA